LARDLDRPTHPGPEEVPVSKSQPEWRNLLHATAQRAYIKTSADGQHARTALLFSISDNEWTAWYKFREQVPEFDRANDADFMLDRLDQQSHLVYGYSIGPLSFKPRRPMRVDEFATRVGGKSPRCLLWSAHDPIKHVLHTNAAIYLPYSTERFWLRLYSKKRKELPAQYEWGYVSLLQVDRGSDTNLRAGRFKKSLLHN
jgi:hypothetical protein